jgi:hypothetical protein
MDHHGHPATTHRPAARRQVGRQCDVAAEPDDDVGVDVVEHGTGLFDGPVHPNRQPQQVSDGLAGQRDRCDELQVVPAFGDEPGFQSTLSAEGGDPHVRVEPAERIGDGHGGFDVACRPATGENYRYGPIHP